MPHAHNNTVTPPCVVRLSLLNLPPRELTHKSSRRPKRFDSSRFLPLSWLLSMHAHQAYYSCSRSLTPLPIPIGKPYADLSSALGSSWMILDAELLLAAGGYNLTSFKIKEENPLFVFPTSLFPTVPRTRYRCTGKSLQFIQQRFLLLWPRAASAPDLRSSVS